MRLPNETARKVGAGLLAAALILTGCFAGSEEGEVAIVSGDPAGPAGDSEAGQGQQSNGSDGDQGDGSGGDNQQSVQNDGPSESELLEIVSGAEGSGANPDNRTGAPPSIPSIFCPPVDGEINFATTNMLAPHGRVRSAMGCLEFGDLNLVTVTAPDGELHERFWTEGLFSVDLSVLDQPGFYQVTAQQRQGATLPGAFDLAPLERLALNPIRTDDGWKLALAGYGAETSVRVAVYRQAGEGALMTDLVYFGSLGDIALAGDGTTVVGLDTDEELLCFYVDAADEARFPDADPGCFDRSNSIATQAGDSAAAQSLNGAIGDPGLMAIGAIVAPIGEGRGTAIATIIDRASGAPIQASLFEGAMNESDPDQGLVSPQLVDSDDGDDFVASFNRMCDAAAARYVVIGNPCLRTVELPPVLVFDYVQAIEVDMVSIIDIIGRAAITDCLPYDPNKLTMKDEGPEGWLLTDGRSRMAMLDNEVDAKVALTVARYHDRHCFVGRSNGRENRDAYVSDFWLGGKPGGPELPGEDCIRYDPAQLEIVSLGDTGWQLAAGRSALLVLDSKLDAQGALNTAAGFTAQCFAGRDNKRADRDRYVFRYWK